METFGAGEVTGCGAIDFKLGGFRTMDEFDFAALLNDDLLGGDEAECAS